jgi:motility quorum-sensing regulator / GCU-specific mRNA interferase toxin
MTEKNTPHFDLAVVKAALSSKLNATRTALTDAAGLGHGSPEIVDIIKTITPAHFYKSMTSNYSAKVWQDVYHSPALEWHAVCKIHR